jgi:hypothetical protein
MMNDDFSIPLGQHRLARRRRFRLSLLPVATGVLGFSAAALAVAWVMRIPNPPQETPTPIAAAPASAAASANGAVPISAKPAAPPLAAEAIETLPAPLPAGRTITIIDGTTGKRREVLIPATANPVGFDQQDPEPMVVTPIASTPNSRPPARPAPAR